ncbi:MAG TPA: hypothetical protein VF053_03065 [Streptosporangiales bacterium]
MDEARTTAASTRASVLRLRGLALAGLGLMAAAATVAAGSPTPSATASDGTSSTLAAKVSITTPTGGEARQGQTVSYSVQLTPADQTTYTNVTVDVSATPDWAAAGLEVTCPDTAKAVTGGCTFDTLTKATTITGTVATTSAKAGDEMTVTATGKDDSGSIGPASSDPTTITAKPSHSPTPTPTPSKTGSPTPSKQPSSSAKPPGGGSKSGSSSGGGGTDPGSHNSNSGSHRSGSTTGTGTTTTTGDGHPHPTLMPTGGLPTAPSLGLGSSLSATTLPGLSTSPAPTPLVAIPPTASTSGSPSLPIQLTGESRGSVHPVTKSVPLAAVGLVLFVMSGWRLLQRRIRKAAVGDGDGSDD